MVGDLKIYKPVTPGLRNRKQLTRFHLHKGSCVKRLSTGKRSTGGRNNLGRITCRHQGGGHKKRVRFIDFNRAVPGPHKVIRLEYDPNRNADLALLQNLSSNEFSYIIRPANLNPEDVIYSWKDGFDSFSESLPLAKIFQSGNCMQLKDIPIGVRIHNVGLVPNGPAKFARSAGTYAEVTGKDPSHAHVRFSSQEVRKIPLSACATIGTVGNENFKLVNWGKAGSSRRRGIRPAVRGIAMSAYDHPHGGKCFM